MDDTDDADAGTAPAGNRDADNLASDGSFNDWLGLTVEDADDGEAVVAVEFEAFKQNLGGVLHGGVTASLVDVAAAIAIRTERSARDADDLDAMATTNLEVNYLRPITDDARATAEVVRAGGTNAVCRVDVESTAPTGESKTVAIGTVTYQLL